MEYKQQTLVAFVGRRGSGKDTAANFAADIFGKVQGEPTLTAYFSFGDVLKNIANNSLDINTADAEALKRMPGIKIANNLDLRTFINKLGDTLKGYFGELVFTDIVIERITNTLDDVKPDLMLVTDVRYPHELAALKKLCEDKGIEFISIKMRNTNLDHEMMETNQHLSESQIETMVTQFAIIAGDVETIKNKMEVICNELC